MVAANSLLLFLLTTGLTPDSDQPTTPIPWRSISETEEPPLYEDNEFESKGLLPCPKHERFDKCLALCQRNCTNYEEKYIPCPLICEPGCVCVDGYVRGPDGNCMPKEKCSSSSDPLLEKCPKHEHWDYCFAHCQKNCSNYDQIIPCTRRCFPGCVCDEDYVRGPNGKCIPKGKCPKESGWESISETEEPPVYEDNEYESDERCPKHSKFDHCRAHPSCQKNCQNYNENFPCPAICMPGCICEDGYVEGPNKECIKKEECRHYSKGWDSISETEEPPVNEDPLLGRKCPEHEHWVICEAHCQKNCTNYKENLPCTKRCVAGCVCDRGYVRGLNGKCIQREKCPKESGWESISETEEPPVNEERCPKHSKFDHCGAHPLCQKNCQNYNENFPCPAICMPGCICEDGYVEGPNKECIKKEECRHYSKGWDSISETEEPPVNEEKCPEHEHWDRCLAHCQKNCTNYDKPLPCPKNCVPGCVCDEGHVRGPNGKCIPKGKCPKESAPLCPEHEHWVLCEAHCQKNCTNYKQNLPCTKQCVAGCVCDTGYVRGPNGKCTLEEKCPKEAARKHKKRVCPPREHISRCMGHCQKTCESYWKPKPCPRKCQKGCVCDGGLVRGPRGRCIMPNKCPAKSDTEETVYNSFCPDNPNGCLEYCKSRGAKHGQCQGYQRAECICINRL